MEKNVNVWNKKKMVWERTKKKREWSKRKNKEKLFFFVSIFVWKEERKKEIYGIISVAYC